MATAMIVELPDTTTSKISKELVTMREQGGVDRPRPRADPAW